MSATTTELPLRDPAQLRDWLHQVLPFASAQALGQLLLDDDTHARRLAPHERHRLATMALNDGYRLADSINRQFVQCGDPLALAQAMDIALVHVPGDSRCGETLFFADYTAKPPTIRLFDHAIGRINRYLAHGEIADALGFSDATPLFVAHELYHHLDCADSEPICKRIRVTVLRLGRWRLTAGIAALAEIGAGAFAQRLLGLRTHPLIIDLVARFDHDQRQASTHCDLLFAKSFTEVSQGFEPTTGTAAW
jgi:hypothetical protein